MNAYDKMSAFLDDIQHIIHETEDEDLGGFNDVVFDFVDDYKYYGYEIDYPNLLQLNFPGTSNWFYFIAISDENMKEYKDDLDQYPVYFVDLESGELTKKSDNFRGFFEQWFTGDERLEQFSRVCKSQPMPTMKLLSDEMCKHYVAQGHD